MNEQDRLRIKAMSLARGDSRQREEAEQAMNQLMAPIPDGTRAALEALMAAIRLLRCVNLKDCGALHCRYCAAKAPDWQHATHCAYEQSSRDYTEARKLAAELELLLARFAASPAPAPCPGCNGKGVVGGYASDGFMGSVAVDVTCPDCKGMAPAPSDDGGPR